MGESENTSKTVVVYLLLDIRGEDLRGTGCRHVWDPKNALARAVISYFDASNNCFAE